MIIFRFPLALMVFITLWMFNCQKQQPQLQSALPARIISLAPSITETLFALGLGDRVIGVTGYCVYPPQVRTREKIGGYADANLEKIISMRPDLVLLSFEHEKQRQYLERFNIPVLAVGNATCAEVCSTFAIIGKRCGVTSAADSLIGLFNERLSAPRRDTFSLPPKVLICVGRDNPGGGRIAGVFVAGKATFYDDLIRAAGGRNALEARGQAYARLSMEGVLAAAPDIVIDIAPAMESGTCDHLIHDWQAVDRLPAVAGGQVHCMSSDYCTVPGPRLLLLLDDLQRIVTAFCRGKKTAS